MLTVMKRIIYQILMIFNENYILGCEGHWITKQLFNIRQYGQGLCSDLKTKLSLNPNVEDLKMNEKDTKLKKEE